MNAECGYSFLIDTNTNTILAHKDPKYNASIISSSYENEFLAKISTLTKNSSFQIYEVAQEEVLYFVALEPIEGTSWILASCVAEEEIFAELTKTSTIYIIIAIVAIFISTIIISEIIAITVRPIRSLTQSISKISDGDFTVSITPKGNDEVSVMSYAMKKYVEDMHIVISEIRKISEQLQKNSMIGKESSVTLKDASYVQAKSMDGMKTTMEQLAYAVNEIANDATVLAQSVENATQNGEQANNAMQTTVTMAGQGYRDMQNLQQDMQIVVNSMNDLSTVVENIGNFTEEINSIVTIIGDIASQTNLLSLNAAIEAARAGEVGRGFAVVASEIGKLADDSAQSVQKIGQIITNITSQVQTMIKKTKDSVTTIEQNSLSIDEACNSFQKIYNEIENTNQIIQEMMKQISTVNDVASNMAAVSEE